MTKRKQNVQKQMKKDYLEVPVLLWVGVGANYIFKRRNAMNILLRPMGVLATR